MLCDNQAGVGVELHTALLSPPWSTLLPSDWFYAGTHSHQLGNLHVRLPDATRNAGHIVAHAQLSWPLLARKSRAEAPTRHGHHQEKA